MNIDIWIEIFGKKINVFSLRIYLHHTAEECLHRLLISR